MTSNTDDALRIDGQRGWFGVLGLTGPARRLLVALDQQLQVALMRKLIALGPFHSLDDLSQISGIGPSRMADIKEQSVACVG